MTIGGIYDHCIKKCIKGKNARIFPESGTDRGSGEELIVTNNNIPTLKVIPIKKKKQVEEVFADIRGTVEIDDSIMLPETEEWDVEQ